MHDLHERHPIVEIDRVRREASIGGVPLALEPKEYELLQALATAVRNRRRESSGSIAALLKGFHVSDR